MLTLGLLQFLLYPHLLTLPIVIVEIVVGVEAVDGMRISMESSESVHKMSAKERIDIFYHKLASARSVHCPGPVIA